MKMETGKSRTVLAAMLLVGIALLPAYAAEHPAKEKSSAAGADFKAIDANKDGYLSMEEFIKAPDKDDLAFRAADIDSDGRLDPAEYAKHIKAQATER